MFSSEYETTTSQPRVQPFSGLGESSFYHALQNLFQGNCSHPVSSVRMIVVIHLKATDARGCLSIMNTNSTHSSLLFSSGAEYKAKALQAVYRAPLYFEERWISKNRYHLRSPYLSCTNDLQQWWTTFKLDHDVPLTESWDITEEAASTAILEDIRNNFLGG